MPAERPAARRAPLRRGRAPRDRLRPRDHRARARHRRRADARATSPILTGNVGTGRRRRGQPAARPEQRPGRLGHGRAARPAARLPEGLRRRGRAPLRRRLGGRDPTARPGCGSRRCSTPRVDGRLKALYVIGEDIAQTDPDSGHVRAAIDACELVVSQEIFLSETAERADVVLPGRRRSSRRTAPSSTSTAASSGCARRSRHPATAPHRLRDHPRGRARRSAPTSAARRRPPRCAEMASLTPDSSPASRTSGSTARARCTGPAGRADDPGEPALYRERFATPNGRAQLAARPYAAAGRAARRRVPVTAGHRAATRALQRRHDDPAHRQPRARPRRAARDPPRRRRRSSASATATGSRWRAAGRDRA